MLRLQTYPPYDTLRPKFNYVLSLFNRWYRLPDEELVLSYGEAGDADIRIRPGNWMEFYGKTLPKPEQISWIEWEGTRLPLLCQKSPQSAIIRQNTEDEQITILADILGTAFYFLSCWQEWMSDRRDQFGRFPASESLLYQWDLLGTPVVNYYYDILASAVSRVTGKKPEVESFSNARFHVALTHDIDQCKTGWIEDSFRALIGGHPFSATRTIWKKLVDSDVWFNFNEIMALEREMDIPASYYFIATKEKYKNVANADYTLNSPEIQAVLNELVNSGHEVGIHGSYGTGWQEEKFKEEIYKFPVPVSGGRFHFLAIRIDKTFDIIEASKLQYDSSLGFAESPGFRSGICWPYYPYNIPKDRQYSFLEFPLVVMDRTFTNYLHIPPADVYSAINNIMNEIRQFSGILNILWHNKSFTGYKYAGWKESLISILNECIAQNADFISLQTIASQGTSDE